MKHIKQNLWALGILLLGFQAALAAGIQSVDSIAAVVDNEAITQRDWDNAVTQLNRNAAPNNQQSDDRDRIRKEALLNLINQSLLTQAGERAGIQISEADIDDELAHVAKTQKMTVDALYRQIAKEGVNRDTLRRTVRKQLLAYQVVQSEVMSKGQVSDEEVAEAIQRAQREGKPLPPPVESHTYHVQHILIKDDTEDTRKLARQIYELARTGTSFAQLASQYSQDGSASQGGDLGWLSEGQTVRPFEAAFKALEPGQISQPVRSQFGWHIIKLVEIQDMNTPEERQFNGMREVLVKEKRSALYSQLLQRLQEQAFIQIRAK
ncbi:peptidylprolyl isomerase [Stenoxybacter acetivorans]|uniref:peptidylprolyl isomerase n=1 Tax=Stenoxybacter acetivorans TaxID=422441 RepID=UPI0006923AED|nr:peptidylprolyl isomerase [Stenoxybacter acetivorans]